MKTHIFILGAQKCGTTALAKMFKKYTSVKVSKPKEPNFFIMDYIPTRKGFSKHMKNCFGRNHAFYDHTLEANVHNLLIPYIPDRIKLVTYGYKLKFIVLIRNPWERMYSHWLFESNVEPGRAYRTFDRAISQNLEKFDRVIDNNFDFEGDITFNSHGGAMVPTFIEGGLYYNQIKRYVNLFGKDNIKIIHQDNLKNNPESVLRELCSFTSCEFNKFEKPLNKNVSVDRKTEEQIINILSNINNETIDEIDNIYKNQMKLLNSEFKGMII